MKYARFLSVVLLLCIVSTLALTACDKDDEVSAALTTDADYKISGTFYKDKTFTFLTNSVNDKYESEILSNTTAYAEENLEQVLPTSVNEDMAERANVLEEVLGLKLEEIKYFSPKRPNGEICDKVRTDVLAGSTDYQVVVPCLFDAASLALEDLFVNLYDVHGTTKDDKEWSLQIDADWWNQEFNKTMTFADQLYFSIGDLGLVNKNSTAAVYVNMKLWDTYSLTEKLGGTPYDLVREGKWTLDKAYEAASFMSNDDNRDNKIDYKDTFGWGGQLDDMWHFFYGAGATIADIGADGMPTLTMKTERNAKLIKKMQEFVQDDDHYISANDYFDTEGVQWPSVLVLEAFTSGRAMFYSGTVSTIINLRNMEDKFAILPVPKYEEKQESYHSLINPWSSTCFAIPTTVTGDELMMTADALNVLCAISQDTVAKNYQEIVIEGRSLRDEDSIDMLNNYIIANYGVDMGLVYKWGGLDGLLQTMESKPVDTFISQYDTVHNMAWNALMTDMKYYQSKAK